MGTNAEEQNKKLSFQMWIELTFLEWQADNKKRATLDDFAKHIGYSRPLISLWMSGKRLPTKEGIERLAELFGPEIYDILDLKRPNLLLQQINRRWDRIPPDKQQRLVELSEQFEMKNDEQQLQESSKPRKKASHK